MVIKEALSKEVLELENPEMGSLEYALKKVDTAGNEILSKGYLGIFVDRVDFHDAAAELIHV